MENTIQLQAPELPETQVFFIASLSNGEIVVEGRGNFEWLKNQKSPWNRLIRYAAQSKVTITSLSLSTPHGATFTIPPAGGKPRFKGYTNKTEEEKPLYFEVKRYLARDMDVGVSDGKAKVDGVSIAEFYTIAQAIYKDFTIEVWVDELDLRHSWVVFNKNK